MLEVGKLIKGKFSDVIYEITRGPYTARFMEEYDYEMMEGGMGHMAGVYGSAVDVIAMSGDKIGIAYIKQPVSRFTIIKNT